MKLSLSKNLLPFLAASTLMLTTQADAAPVSDGARTGLTAALNGEAYAYTRYRALARQAQNSGAVELAHWLEAEASDEAEAHFLPLAERLGDSRVAAEQQLMTLEQTFTAAAAADAQSVFGATATEAHPLTRPAQRVAAALRAEHQEYGRTYRRFAERAVNEGDAESAALLQAVAAGEQAHYEGLAHLGDVQQPIRGAR